MWGAITGRSWASPPPCGEGSGEGTLDRPPKQLGHHGGEVAPLDLVLWVRRSLRPAQAPDDLADLPQLHLAAVRNRGVDRDAVHPRLCRRDRLPLGPLLVSALECVLAAVFSCGSIAEHCGQRAENAAV